MSQRAFVVRMTTGGGDVADLGRELGMLLVGWSGARGLDSPELGYEDFRERIHAAHFEGEADYRRSGRAAGTLWRFMREMEPGDLVVVPRPGCFWVGAVAGDAFEDDAGGDTDTVHRRPVKWIDGGAEVPRRRARAALVARMKSRGTVTDAADLVDDIRLALEAVETPSGAATLRDHLVDRTRDELLSGYFDERRFEELVRDVLQSLGAVEPRIVPRQHDVGADVVAEFPVAGLTLVTMHVQVKYWHPDHGPAGTEPIEQLVASMDSADIGMVVTTTGFTDEARRYALECAEVSGKQILLYDGQEFSQLIVDQGLRDLVA